MKELLLFWVELFWHLGIITALFKICFVYRLAFGLSQTCQIPSRRSAFEKKSHSVNEAGTDLNIPPQKNHSSSAHIIVCFRTGWRELVVAGLSACFISREHSILLYSGGSLPHSLKAKTSIWSNCERTAWKGARKRTVIETCTNKSVPNRMEMNGFVLDLCV